MLMGIQKISVSNSSCGRISYPSSAHGRGVEDNPVFGVDLDDDPEDCELTESSCELGMVEGKLCSIPYELYDLPDLRNVLSLDIWNSCLTEEERFYLSAYLPDMDQQTFYLTMKELFDGSNVYFGNPLDTFFKRLKGGFYPPKVTCCREGLQFLQKKMYFHSLRSYHNRMVQMFIDMRGIWAECETTSSVEERISIWKKRNQRAINLLDLNECPKDDQMICDVKLDVGVKSMERKKVAKENLPLLSANGTKLFPLSGRAKGILKMKASGYGLQNHNPKIVIRDLSKQCHPVPKGVLKIVPKVSSLHLQQSEVVPGGAQATYMIRTQGLQDFKFSSLPASLHVQDAGGLYGSPFLKLKLDGSRTDSTLDQPLCLLNQQESTIGTSNHIGFTRKIKGGIVPTLDNISVLGKHKLLGGDVRSGLVKVHAPSLGTMDASSYAFRSENLLPNLGIGTKDISLRSSESHSFGYGGQQHLTHKNEERISIHPSISQAISRTSDAGNSKQETLMVSSLDQTEVESHVNVGKLEKVLCKSNVSVRPKDESVLPLTYKRRKAVAKVNSIGTGISLISGAGLNDLNSEI